MLANNFVRWTPAIDEGASFAAQNSVDIFVEAIILLATNQSGSSISGPLVHNREVVVHISALGNIFAQATPARARATHWWFISKGPIDFVNAVNRLLNNDVARKPHMVLPIAKLKLHVAPLGLARIDAQWTGEIITVHG